ncbi:MAG: metal dependent hydrolase [Bacillales bacterium]|nr:metal dependent hydrolase [Bacillales bacterium]
MIKIEVYVARQPIFTKSKEIYAYELLYRENQINRFSEMNGELATTDVIINSFINIGINDLSNFKPCFINFTEKLLKLRIPFYFKQNEIVVEILETVEINQELLEICKELKNNGYKIALDDFVLNKENPCIFPLLEIADIIKVDFRATTAKTRHSIEEISQKYNFKLLAEKIETKEEYEIALNNGYEYFQGYYFSTPDILSSRDVPDHFQNCLVIINFISKNEPNLDAITQLIEQDLSISYKLLKLINSPAYRSASKINSIRQAIVRLGLNELQKWLYILSIRGGIVDKNEWTIEVYKNSLIRAKVCESISLQLNKGNESSAYFLTGLFSLMDTLLGMNMEAILKLVPLQEMICDALKGVSNHMKEILDLTISIERGFWGDVSLSSKKLNIKEETAVVSYYDAIQWVNEIIKA